MLDNARNDSNPKISRPNPTRPAGFPGGYEGRLVTRPAFVFFDCLVFYKLLLCVGVLIFCVCSSLFPLTKQIKNCDLQGYNLVKNALGQYTVAEQMSNGKNLECKNTV